MTSEKDIKKPASPEPKPENKKPGPKVADKAVEEIGGPKGPEPTRYGDWEQKGRCTDF